MHNVDEELIRRQGNCPEREYSMLDTGTLVYVQNSRQENWQPAIMVKPTDAPDSYWVQFGNGAILRRTCSALKVKSSPTCGEVHSHQKEWNGETDNVEFHQ